MFPAKREVEVGTGVIDCTLGAEDGEGHALIVAGDVSGRIAVFDHDLSAIYEKELDLPVWGTSIDSGRSLVAVALAAKQEFQGGLVVIDFASGETVCDIRFPAPAWDALIDREKRMVYVSTWGKGILWYDLDTQAQGTLAVSNHVFGLSLRRIPGRDDQLLVASVSGVGVVGVELPSGQRTPPPDPVGTILVKSEHACYKHCFTEDLSRLFVGSSGPVIPFGTKRGSDGLSFNTRTFRSIMRDVAGVAATHDIALLGSLSGTLQICRPVRPEAPIAFVDIGSSIWSIAPGSQGVVWVARGDGFLAEYEVADLVDAEMRTDAEEIEFGPGSLGGAKVFLSYASEDFDHVADLYRYLRAVGCTPWMDKFDILPGQAWEQEIRSALERCDFAIICLSEHSVNKRGYVQKEVHRALELLDEVPEGEIFLIPARLDDSPVPATLRQRQWVDLSAEDGLRRLCTAIYRGYLARRPDAE
jgi:hypothetical protein